MFNRRKPAVTHELDQTITYLIDAFAGLEDGSDEQAASAQSIKTLMEARTADRTATNAPIVDPNILVSAAASLIGIISILGFEKANVVTTKSLSFIPKITK